MTERRIEGHAGVVSTIGILLLLVLLSNGIIRHVIKTQNAPPDWVFWPACVVVALISWFMRDLVLFFYRPIRKATTAKAYLAADRCPSCNYNLESLDPEQDGHVLCPECGAAW